ncbi:MAG: hypothetical protein R3F65_27800 [bacterium]
MAAVEAFAQDAVVAEAMLGFVAARAGDGAVAAEVVVVEEDAAEGGAGVGDGVVAGGVVVVDDGALGVEEQGLDAGSTGGGRS